MTRIDEINKEIKSLKEKIVNLENEKNNINFLKKLDLDSNVLKRVGNIQVEVNNSSIYNDSDEYASNKKHELKLKHNYTIVEFVSPGEVKAHLCNIELNYEYQSNQTYHNRYDPDIECNLEVKVIDTQTNKKLFSYNGDPEDLEDLDYDKTNGDWGIVIKAIIDKCDGGERESWNAFIEELDK